MIDCQTGGDRKRPRIDDPDDSADVNATAEAESAGDQDASNNHNINHDEHESEADAKASNGDGDGGDDGDGTAATAAEHMATTRSGRNARWKPRVVWSPGHGDHVDDAPRVRRPPRRDGAAADDGAAPPHRSKWDIAQSKLGAIVARVRGDRHMLRSYETDGWRGGGSAKARPSAELDRAHKRVRGACIAARAALFEVRHFQFLNPTSEMWCEQRARLEE